MNTKKIAQWLIPALLVAAIITGILLPASAPRRAEAKSQPSQNDFCCDLTSVSLTAGIPALVCTGSTGQSIWIKSAVIECANANSVQLTDGNAAAARSLGSFYVAAATPIQVGADYFAPGTPTQGSSTAGGSCTTPGNGIYVYGSGSTTIHLVVGYGN